jgi:hypothetical protein
LILPETIKKYPDDGYLTVKSVSTTWVPVYRELVHLLCQCSNNLNQYVKKAHQTGSIYEEDVRDLKERFDEFWRIGKELLTRLSTIW